MYLSFKSISKDLFLSLFYKELLQQLLQSSISIVEKLLFIICNLNIANIQDRTNGNLTFYIQGYAHKMIHLNSYNLGFLQHLTCLLS